LRFLQGLHLWVLLLVRSFSLRGPARALAFRVPSALARARLPPLMVVTSPYPLALRPLPLRAASNCRRGLPALQTALAFPYLQGLLLARAAVTFTLPQETPQKLAVLCKSRVVRPQATAAAWGLLRERAQTPQVRSPLRLRPQLPTRERCLLARGAPTLLRVACSCRRAMGAARAASLWPLALAVRAPAAR